MYSCVADLVKSVCAFNVNSSYLLRRLCFHRWGDAERPQSHPQTTADNATLLKKFSESEVQPLRDFIQVSSDTAVRMILEQTDPPASQALAVISFLLCECVLVHVMDVMATAKVVLPNCITPPIYVLRRCGAMVFIYTTTCMIRSFWPPIFSTTYPPFNGFIH